MSDIAAVKLLLPALLLPLMFYTPSVDAQWFEIDHDVTIPGEVSSIALDAHRYLIASTFAMPETPTRFNRILLTEIDECSVVRMRTLHFALNFSLRHLREMYMYDDSIRLTLAPGSSSEHGHQEIGLLSIDPVTLDCHYRFIRALNVFYPHSIRPTPNGNFLAFGYISYIDRPTAYALVLLDRSFKIITSYSNSQSARATGFVVMVEDGFICVNDQAIFKMSPDLVPVWSKNIQPEAWIMGGADLSDGIMFMTSPIRYDAVGFIKIDYEGNIVWRGEGLDFSPGNFRALHGGQFNTESYGLAMQLRNGSEPRREISTVFVNPAGQFEMQRYGFQPPADTWILRHYNHGTQSTLLAATATSSLHLIVNGGNLSEECVRRTSLVPDSQITFDVESASTVPAIIPPLSTGGFEMHSDTAMFGWDLICIEVETPDFLPADTTICFNENFVADLSQIPYPVDWSDGSEEKMRSFTQPGIYSYEYMKCDELFSESFELIKEDCKCKVYAPNIFSPNGDGANDQFAVSIDCADAVDYQLQIFNRWGALVFESQVISDQWAPDAEQISPGVYVFHVSFVDPQSGRVQHLSGTVTIVK